MITAAPLPDWSDLLAVLDSSVPGDRAVALPWMADGGRAYLFSRSAWSLAALVAARKIEGVPRPRMWLPGFFCNASSGPARAAGAEITFYPVTASLTPDWAACKDLAEQAPPSLFVLVHYFGAANDIAGARTFCSLRGAVLIEDAAHVLKPTSKIGSAGDFVLYSPHKVIGIPDGAILVARRPSESLDRAHAAMPTAVPSPWTWVAKRTLQLAIPEPIWKTVRPIPDIPHDRDPPAEVPSPCPAMSIAARKMLAHASERLEIGSASRRYSEKMLRDFLSRTPGWSAWPAVWEADETPYRGVFIGDTASIAADRFSRLRRAGCLVESWPDLAPEVIADPIMHRTSIDLRQRLLSFVLGDRRMRWSSSWTG